jgi:SAM-dependent methyltransferase
MELRLMSADAYRVQPLRVVDGLPVFSSADGYVENYQRIAADHVAAIRPGQANPFIGDELWQALEDSTRVLVLKHVAPGSRILDVGVGLGRLLGPLPQYRRFGIDISFDYLKQARALGIEVAFARVEDMPFHDAYFDAVTVCDVLEHVLDLDGCVRQLLRVLKPGGVLIVRVPYREDLSPYLAPSVPYEYIHLRNFDEHSLALLFAKVHRCTVLEHAQVAPALQGAARLKLRLLPADNAARYVGPAKPVSRRDRLLAALSEARKVLFKPGEPPHPLQTLRDATAVSEEEFTAWIYQLKNEHPEQYRDLAPHLVLGMDINMVVRKP